MKKLIDVKFVMRLVVVQLILIGIQLLTMPALFNILTDSAPFHWCILILECAVCVTFLFLDANVKGSKDVQQDEISRKQNERLGKAPDDFEPKFLPLKGIVCGALAEIPLILASLVLQVAQWMGAPFAEDIETVMRGASMMMAQLWRSFTDVPGALFLVLCIGFIGIAGIGYYNGLAQRRRLGIMIERNNARIARGQAIKKARNKRR